MISALRRSISAVLLCTVTDSSFVAQGTNAPACLRPRLCVRLPALSSVHFWLFSLRFGCVSASDPRAAACTYSCFSHVRPCELAPTRVGELLPITDWVWRGFLFFLHPCGCAHSQVRCPHGVGVEILNHCIKPPNTWQFKNRTANLPPVHSVIMLRWQVLAFCEKFDAISSAHSDSVQRMSVQAGKRRHCGEDMLRDTSQAQGCSQVEYVVLQETFLGQNSRACRQLRNLVEKSTSPWSHG